MKAYFIIIYMLILIYPACTYSQTKQESILNQKVKDSRGNDMLIGKCTRSALLESPFNEWFKKNYDDYKVDSTSVLLVKPLLKNKSVTIFMGTWCGDSRREVPRMLKILDCCGFPEQQLQLVMLSNQEETFKQSPQHEEQDRNIFRVPTFIIEENRQENGRIVEFPVISLEKDLLSILQKENYVPHYSVTDMLLKKLSVTGVADMEKETDAMVSSMKPMLSYPLELGGLGYLLLCRKRTGESLYVYRLNTLMNPDDPRAYNSLAEAYYKTGDTAKAKETLNKSMALDVNNAAAKELMEKISN